MRNSNDDKNLIRFKFEIECLSGKDINQEIIKMIMFQLSHTEQFYDLSENRIKSIQKINLDNCDIIKNELYNQNALNMFDNLK